MLINFDQTERGSKKIATGYITSIRTGLQCNLSLKTLKHLNNNIPSNGYITSPDKRASAR